MGIELNVDAVFDNFDVISADVPSEEFACFIGNGYNLRVLAIHPLVDWAEIPFASTAV